MMKESMRSRHDKQQDEKDGLGVPSQCPCLACMFASIAEHDIPFGRAKTPDLDPLSRALLNRLLNCASETVERLLFAWTYFLRAWRL